MKTNWLSEALFRRHLRTLEALVSPLDKLSNSLSKWLMNWILAKSILSSLVRYVDVVNQLLLTIYIFEVAQRCGGE